MSGISRDEWLRALEAAHIAVVDDQSATTATEFADLFGLDRQSALRKLQALEKSGQATRTTKTTRGIDGRRYSSPAFKLAPGPKKRR